VHTSLTSSPVVVLDANVLFPLSLRDLLFRAVEKGLYRLQISREIWDEVIRNLVENGRMTPEGAAYLDMRVQEFLAENDALVSGYEALVPTLTNDPKDRHVLAAAIHAHAEAIVTFNLKDFPADALARYGIVAEHPDVFLCRLHGDNPDILLTILREQAAGLRKPPLTIGDVLDTLARHIPSFVSLVRPALVDLTSR
jgi:predicted nucleic acid-binding protein